MSRAIKIPGSVALFLAAIGLCAWAQDTASSSFPPFEQWKSAILAGDTAALKSMYSVDPPAQIHISSSSVRDAHDAVTDINFWMNLKPRGMKTEVVRDTPRHGHISYIFRAEVQPANGAAVNITVDQSWLEQGGQWHIISVERTDAPRLMQPADMKKNLYPADADAHAEIKKAEARASASSKRLLLVFGANWCFDCHVLDLAFQRPDLAPILVANYEVVHIDLGEDEHKNADLVAQYEIPLNKGIPAIAVAESDGKLVTSQKNGEFEDARGLAPDVLAEFLNKWKP
jgi:thioredoxin 1